MAGMEDYFGPRRRYTGNTFDNFNGRNDETVYFIDDLKWEDKYQENLPHWSNNPELKDYRVPPAPLQPNRPSDNDEGIDTYEDVVMLKYLKIGVSISTLIAENLLSHPFVVLRRQCQVHNFSQTYHLLPVTLLPVIWRLNQHQGLSTLWKGLGSVFLIRGMSLAIEDVISKFTPWPKDFKPHSSIKAHGQHLLLKCITLAITTPFYSASLVETVQSDIASEETGVFDVFREGICRLISWGSPQKGRMLPVWNLVVPSVVFGILKYLIGIVIKNATSRMLQLSYEIDQKKKETECPALLESYEACGAVSGQETDSQGKSTGSHPLPDNFKDAPPLQKTEYPALLESCEACGAVSGQETDSQGRSTGSRPLPDIDIDIFQESSPPLQGAVPKGYLSQCSIQDIETTAGFVAVVGAESLMYPLETILHRLHLQGTRTIIDNLDTGSQVVPILTNYEGAGDCYDEILKEEGVTGLYKGFGALILQFTAHYLLIKVTKAIVMHAICIFHNSPQSINSDIQKAQSCSNLGSGIQKSQSSINLRTSIQKPQPSINSDTRVQKSQLPIISHVRIQNLPSSINSNSRIQKPKPSINSGTRIKPQTSINSDTRIKPQTSINSDTRIKPQTSINSDTRIKPQTSIISDTRIKPQTSINSDTRIKPQTSINSDTRIKPQTSIISDTRIKPQTSINSDTRIEPQSSVNSDPEIQKPPSSTSNSIPVIIKFIS
ncbi:solute carrier family 25 member 46a isoform X2 [Lycorma delicatula]|uniref:solute carrier family 25 member 46a isoform X2 n=1 Tax=Lycorma delicatula TaxID=130591 RepID=UPI003F510F79